MMASRVLTCKKLYGQESTPAPLFLSPVYHLSFLGVQMGGKATVFVLYSPPLLRNGINGERLNAGFVAGGIIRGRKSGSERSETRELSCFLSPDRSSLLSIIGVIMASSNRHWPSLFKSKPCNSHLQWPHDVSSSSLLSSACQKTPYASVAGCEERSPEPKPRWNPKPEQIRILEAIFNSGMVNPPREEIRKIRAQLQEYGQVGDANVFYWFQNRKSRSKHKQRNLQATRQQSRFTAAIPAASASAGSSSSSSSSERSTSSEKALISTKIEGASPTNDTSISNSPAAPVSQTLFQQANGDFYEEPFFFHGLPEYCFSAADFACFVGVPDGGLGLCHGLFTDLMSNEKCNKGTDEDAMVQMRLHHGYYGLGSDSAAATADIATAAAAKTADTMTNAVQGIGTYGARTTVFINGLAFDVGMGLVNLREAFGENAVLLHSSGHPVLVDDWGVTLHPLQHGASYYLI